MLCKCIIKGKNRLEDVIAEDRIMILHSKKKIWMLYQSVNSGDHWVL